MIAAHRAAGSQKGPPPWPGMRAEEAAMTAAVDADSRVTRTQAQWESGSDEKFSTLTVEGFRRIPIPGHETIKTFAEV